MQHRGYLLVSEDDLHSLIGWHTVSIVESHLRGQVVHLALNQSIHRPEDGIQVGDPHPVHQATLHLTLSNALCFTRLI